MAVVEIYPVKAQYLKGELVKIAIEADSEDCVGKHGFLQISHLNSIEKMIEVVTENTYQELEVGRFERDFAGYRADLFWEFENQPVAMTSFDVVKNPQDSVRYGFLSDFRQEEIEKNEDLENLRKYHINFVQFYDWSFRHDQLVSLESEYEDMMGKKVSLETVKEKIRIANRFGMKSMAYGAVYAATKEFYEQHKDWAFYNGNGEVLRFIDIFYIMNIEKKSPWHMHIINQYADAMERVGFTGIHMDTYGSPKKAYSDLDGDIHLVCLEDEFAELIQDTKMAVSAINKENYLIFNNVGNWPVREVANTDQAAIYIEVWNPYDHYFQIKEIIENAKRACNRNKPIVLAAYLAPFRLEDENKAGMAAYLLTAVIVTNGAYHLLLGEENGVLTQGYYVEHETLSLEQASKMRRYYDFMICYLELFYDETMRDVSMTHIGWDNYEYQCNFLNWSSCGEAGKIWVTLKENDNYKTISLINLCGVSDDFWNQGKEKPTEQHRLSFQVFVEKHIQSVFCDTPDGDGDRRQTLEYQYMEDEKGSFILFELPHLEIWSLITIVL